MAGKKSEFFDYTLIDSVRDWKTDWFYTGNMFPPLAVHSNAAPVVTNKWEKNSLSAAEFERIRPFLDRINTLKLQGLTGVGIVASFIRLSVLSIPALMILPA